MTEEAPAATTTQTTEAPPPAATATDTTKTPATTQATESRTTQTAQTQTEKPKMKPRDFVVERVQEREKKALSRVAELEKKLSELEVSKTNQTEAAPVSFLDDPDKWAQGVTERAEQRALDALSQREARTQYNQSAEKAVDWLLTRSHIKEDTKLAELVAQVVKERYQHIFQVDPEVAIERGYLAVCEAKGISPDFGAFKSTGTMNATGGNSTSGVRPSATASGKRVFTKGEGTKYVYDAPMGSPEFNRRLAEVEEAQREGRIR